MQTKSGCFRIPLLLLRNGWWLMGGERECKGERECNVEVFVRAENEFGSTPLRFVVFVLSLLSSPLSLSPSPSFSRQMLTMSSCTFSTYFFLVVDPLSICLYKELYYRHIYSKLTPTVQQRADSFQNYCDLFNHILGT